MTKTVYINGLGLVSAQKTLDNKQFLEEITPPGDEYFRCQEPNYKAYVSGDMVRRMSRIIKMGISAARMCLEDAGSPVPDAIITGTGLGCIEDTEKFLANLIRNNEELLTPTSFIQSTHNTVSGQIALLLKCHAYNFTYCHRGFSFETALIDSLIRLHSGEASSVLTGGMDELTANAFRITRRLGHWKKDPSGITNLFARKDRGSIAGEGAGFFLLSDQKTEHTIATLKGVKTIYKPGSPDAIHAKIKELLGAHGLRIEDVDLIILGMNGDGENDKPYRALSALMPATVNIAAFKHLSGEFHTSGVFALWLASMIIRHDIVPDVVKIGGTFTKPVRNILIYNHYQEIEHTLILAGSV
jgi:3-oxoacyl-[acyl-carrier-protein] synthase II